MAADYWIIAPAGESTGSGLSGTLPAGSRIVRTTAGSAADKAYSQALIDNNSPAPARGWEVVTGPFQTQAQAEAFSPASSWQALGGAIGGATSILVAGKPSAGAITAGENAGAAVGNFQLSLAGIGAWFARGLKMLFGGILIVMAVAHLTGTDKQLTQMIATKIYPEALAAA